jgi:hypothetical protein
MKEGTTPTCIVERADEIVPVDLSVTETDLDSSELVEVSN